MKAFLLYTSLFISYAVWSQDKIYFLDGTSKTGRVLEISDDQVVANLSDVDQTIEKRKILLIEFKNGSVEVCNVPKENVIYNSATVHEASTPGGIQKKFTASNFGSLNTLALCNADVSGFYEKILPNRQIGLGVMGAYNFNVQAGFSNLFIAILNNAKKKYDLGAFANLYFNDLESDETTIYMGVLFKYMSFDFTKVTEVKSTGGAVTLKYSSATGNQLATVLTCGTHTNLNKNFFIKTIFGLGGFNMRGDYRQQYNYFINGGATPNTNQPTFNRKFLLKLYFGLNVGFAF